MSWLHSRRWCSGRSRHRCIHDPTEPGRSEKTSRSIQFENLPAIRRYAPVFDYVPQNKWYDMKYEEWTRRRRRFFGWNLKTRQQQKQTDNNYVIYNVVYRCNVCAVTVTRVPACAYPTSWSNEDAYENQLITVKDSAVNPYTAGLGPLGDAYQRKASVWKYRSDRRSSYTRCSVTSDIPITDYSAAACEVATDSSALYHGPGAHNLQRRCMIALCHQPAEDDDTLLCILME